MEVGFYIRDHIGDPGRPMHRHVEEAVKARRQAKSMGFSVIFMPQHYISHLPV